MTADADDHGVSRGRQDTLSEESLSLSVGHPAPDHGNELDFDGESFTGVLILGRHVEGMVCAERVDGRPLLLRRCPANRAPRQCDLRAWGGMRLTTSSL